MGGRPLPIRLPESTVERLGVRAQRMQLEPRALAQRYAEEGLRADEHPLVRFVDGPAGRRARLLGTACDVWEVTATVRDNDGDVAGTAEFLELPLGLVQAAVAYYGAYLDEIDGWTPAMRKRLPRHMPHGGRASRQRWSSACAAARRAG